MLSPELVGQVVETDLPELVRVTRVVQVAGTAVLLLLLMPWQIH